MSITEEVHKCNTTVRQVALCQSYTLTSLELQYLCGPVAFGKGSCGFFTVDQ